MKNKLDFKLINNGELNIVFLNGFRMDYASWDKVYPEISKNNQVLLFNRRGVGSSAKAIENQTGKIIVSELYQLLKELELKPPYLLVAHSLGGVFANLFARTYPNDVSGVVFVDAPHPSEIVEQKKFKAPLLLRAINDVVKRIEKHFDKYKYSEDESIEETGTQLEKSGLFPDIPIAIVSGTKKMPFMPKKAFDIHLNFQSKLLGLTKESRQYLCNQSGHFPQITEPEIVITAILETLKNNKT